MGRTGRLFRMASGGSLTVHGAIIVSLAASSYLRVEPLAEPRIPERLIIPVVLPQTPGTPIPPPPPAGSAGSAARARPHAAAAPQPALRAAQPRRIPDAPLSTSKVPEPGASGEDAGSGGPFGVPGVTGPGDGLPWGIEGGIGTGAGPGNVLEGLPHDDRPVYLTTDVTPPEKLVDVVPRYPEAARLSRTPGTVILQIVIGRDGDVEEAIVIKSAPLFDEAALAAVRQWKYRPALRAGRPVRVFQTVRVVFAIR